MLEALGLPEEVALSSLRFGIGRSNDIEEIEWVAERLVEVVGALRGQQRSGPLSDPQL